MCDQISDAVVDAYLAQDPDSSLACAAERQKHRQPSESIRLYRGDAGLMGRKITVDTYGGGAFSGKDYSKVDRSGAYAARWVAKSLIKAKLCRRVLVQVLSEIR